MTLILGDLADTSGWITQYGGEGSLSLKQNLTRTWCGAAFDYGSNEMHLVSCGGHGDSWLNQSFKVKVPSGLCYATDPNQTTFPPDAHGAGYTPVYADQSTVTNGNGFEADGTTPVTPYVSSVVIYKDGKTPSRHTYGGSVWLPTQQRVLQLSGAPWALGAPDPYVGWFDPIAGTWVRKANAPYGYGGISAAYDTSRDVVYWNRQGTTIYKYDPASDTHTKIGPPLASVLGGDNGVFVSLHLNGDNSYLYAIKRNGWQQASYVNCIARMQMGQGGLTDWAPVAVSGDMTIMNCNCPGFEYDPDRNAFVFWAYEYPNEVAILSLSNFSVVRVPIAGATAPNADALFSATGGTWGRFRRYTKNSYCVLVSALYPLFLITLR